jgi:hypothetical protein
MIMTKTIYRAYPVKFLASSTGEAPSLRGDYLSTLCNYIIQAP